MPRRPIAPPPAALALVSLLAGLAAAPAVLQGQSGPKFSLRLRPQVGDTIHMRMDQVTEMTGTLRGVDSTATATSRTRVAARAIVRQVEYAAATVLATVDSVEAVGGSRASRERLKKAITGRQVLVRVAADGSMDLDQRAQDAPPEMRGLFASMPPTLPREPVAVGESWHRAIPVPALGEGGAMRSGGMIRAVFTLDSLSREGELAFVSMRASLTREAPSSEVPPGARFVVTAVLAGTMQVNRKRGWMTDSRTTISVHSVATPPPGSGDDPMHFRMKVTQWLRAVDKR